MGSSSSAGSRPFFAALILAAGLLAVSALTFPRPADAQKLVTIDTPSSFVDLSNQNLAGPVTPDMGPHPGKLMANVLLPDGYTPKKRYPLLLLLHGSGERFDSWADPLLGDIRNTAKGLNAVIVMPEGAQGFYTDWWNDGERGNPAWEKYIRYSLLPTVQRRFSIRPQRRYHAVAGFSMGGYGTWLTASQLPGFFGTAVPLSAFASIRDPLSVVAFATAAGGTPYESVYGPPGTLDINRPQDGFEDINRPQDGFYAIGHDPVALGPNYRHTVLDVYTGDGQPDPDVRPENDPGNPGYITEGDAISLTLEGVLKTQNDSAVAAARAAGNPNVDYTVHKGSHDWEFWRPDLESAISKGLFRRVPEQPSAWTFRSAASSGQAWDITYEFSPPSEAVTTFERNGHNLKAKGSGSVTIIDGNGCPYTHELPFTRKLPAKPCRDLKLRVKGKLRKGHRSTLAVKVKGLNSAAVTAPVDAAKVKVAGRSAQTAFDGTVKLKVKPRKAGHLVVKATKPGYRPARVKLKVRR